jgi:hypothetical protein
MCTPSVLVIADEVKVVQLDPPFAVRSTPQPKLEVFSSPVPAYTMLGSTGSIATAPMCRTHSDSVSGTHDAPAFVVFHTPPPAVETYHVSRFDGWIAILLTRPASSCWPDVQKPSCASSPAGPSGTNEPPNMADANPVP